MVERTWRFGAAREGISGASIWTRSEAGTGKADVRCGVKVAEPSKTRLGPPIDGIVVSAGVVRVALFARSSVGQLRVLREKDARRLRELLRMNMNPNDGDVLVLDILTAPVLTEHCPRLLRGDPWWHGHPLASKIIGVAAARVACVGTCAHVTWYGLETGGEESALDYAMDVLTRHEVAVVTYGGAHYALRLLQHRMLDHGVSAPDTWAQLRRTGVDLADEVALHGRFPRVSLPQAFDLYDLLAHPPADAHVDGCNGEPVTTPDALAARLRSRMDAIIALYCHFHVGPLGSIAGSLVLHQTSQPEPRLRLAS